MAIHHIRGIFGRYGRVKQVSTLSNSFFAPRSSLAARSYSIKPGDSDSDLFSSSHQVRDVLTYVTFTAGLAWLMHWALYIPMKEVKAEHLRLQEEVKEKAQAKEAKGEV